jgi:hypothetical protein
MNARRGKRPSMHWRGAVTPANFRTKEIAAISTGNPIQKPDKKRGGAAKREPGNWEGRK